MCLKNSICSFLGGGGKRVTKGRRDILLKMEKIIGFSWLANHPPLPADHEGAPETGDGWDQGHLSLRKYHEGLHLDSEP